jgi:hypothetical protein
LEFFMHLTLFFCQIYLYLKLRGLSRPLSLAFFVLFS